MVENKKMKTPSINKINKIIFDVFEIKLIIIYANAIKNSKNVEPIKTPFNMNFLADCCPIFLAKSKFSSLNIINLAISSISSSFLINISFFKVSY